MIGLILLILISILEGLKLILEEYNGF